MKRRRAKSKLIPQTSQSMLTLRPPVEQTEDAPDASDMTQDEEDTELLPPEQSPKTASFLKKLTADLAFDSSEPEPRRPSVQVQADARPFETSPKTKSFLEKWTSEPEPVTPAMTSPGSSDVSAKSQKGKSAKTESFLKKWFAGQEPRSPDADLQKKSPRTASQKSTGQKSTGFLRKWAAPDKSKRKKSVPVNTAPPDSSDWSDLPDTSNMSDVSSQVTSLKRERAGETQETDSPLSRAAAGRYPATGDSLPRDRDKDIKDINRDIDDRDMDTDEHGKHGDVDEDTIKFIPIKPDSFTTFETIPTRPVPFEQQSERESQEQQKKSTFEEAFQSAQLQETRFEETHFEKAQFPETRLEKTPDKQDSRPIWVTKLF